MQTEEIPEHPFSTDTVSKHMTEHICTGSPDDTVNDYLAKLRRCSSPAESLTNIYVTDSDGKLAGVIGLPDLLKCDPQTKLSSLMLTKDLVTVRPHTDRERAARLAIHKKIKSLPVVDKDNRLIGVLRTQSILQILHEENVEDLLRAAGFRHTRAGEGTFIDILKARVSTLIRARAPWLLLGLIGGMAATSMVSVFEKQLEKHVVLAFFIPVIVYMADAVGTQTEALYLRMYDTGGFHFKSYMLREIKVAIGIGLLSAILLFSYTLLFFHDIKIATIVGTSTFATIFVSVFIATIIPSIIAKMKKDPAVGSGPFATVIQDILSLAIYFAIALWILG